MYEESPHVSNFMASEAACSTPSATEVVIHTSQNLNNLVSRSPQGRKSHGLENFFTGKSRLAYGLERSISSPGSSATDEKAQM